MPADVSRQNIDFSSCHGVIYFNVNTSGKFLRTIAVQKEIIGAENSFKAAYFGSDFLCSLCINSSAKNIVQCIQQHAKTCPQNYDCNDNAQKTIQVIVPQKCNSSTDQRCKGYNSIKKGIRSGGNQRIGFYRYTGLFGVMAKEQFDRNRYGDNE